MSNAVRTKSASNGATPDGWARLADIARASGDPLRTLNHRLQSLPDHAKRRDGRAWLVDLRFVPEWHRSLVTATHANGDKSAEDESKLRLWDKPSIRRDALIHRIVEDAEKYVVKHKTGRLTVTQLERTFCKLFGGGYYELQFGWRTLKNWQRGVRKGKRFPEKRGRKGRSRKLIGVEAEKLFLSFYLLNSGVTFQAAYDMVAARAAECEGDDAWSWPNCRTVRRWREREHPDFFTDKYRRGVDYWRANYEPKMDRDPMNEPGNRIWELDASKCNFFGRFNGAKARFMYAIVVDVGTRLIVGHAVGRSESTELLVRALRRAVIKYGAPEILRTDQGKANRGAAIGDARRRRKGLDWTEITGIVSDMKAELDLRTGRSGWQKGTVESMINVIGKNFDPLFGKAWLGHNTKSRIRGVDQWADDHVDELNTIEDVDRMMGRFLETLNSKPRRDMEGLSPIQKFNKTAIPMRVVRPEVLDFRLRRAQRCKVNNRGVVVRLGTGATLCFGKGEPRIWELIGKEVVARIDDDDLSQVLVCDHNDKPLFWVASGERGLNSQSMREAGKIKQRARKQLRDHWSQVDIDRTPLVEVALDLKEQSSAKQSAAKAAAHVEERPRLILHSEQVQAKVNVEAQRLRKAVGAECDEGPSLSKVMGKVSPVSKEADRPRLSDIQFGQEDRNNVDRDPMRSLRRSSHDNEK